MVFHIMFSSAGGGPSGHQPGQLHGNTASPTSGTPYTWTKTDDFVHTQGMYRYVLVCGSTAFHVLVCTGKYRYVPNSNYQNMVYTGVYRNKELMVFHSGGIDFRSIRGGIHFSRTAQHILVLQVQNNPFSSKLYTKNVYTGT